MILNSPQNKLQKIELNHNRDFRVVLFFAVLVVWALLTFSFFSGKKIPSTLASDDIDLKSLTLKPYFTFTPLNINAAALEELMILPGIGEKYAGAIIRYRSQKGSFAAIEELKQIQGIGAGTLEKLRPFITL